MFEISIYSTLRIAQQIQEHFIQHSLILLIWLNFEENNTLYFVIKVKGDLLLHPCSSRVVTLNIPGVAFPRQKEEKVEK